MSQTNYTGTLNEAVLKKYNQEKLLSYIKSTDKNTSDRLDYQINSIDWSFLEPHKSYDSVDDIKPIDILYKHTIDSNTKEYEAKGLETIRQGKLALVLLAGGQGTRLGYDHPKGMFNVGVESVDNTGSIQKVSDLFDFTALYHMTSGSDECTLVAAIGEFGNDFFDGTYAMVGNRVENDAISHNTIPFHKQISIWR